MAIPCRSRSSVSGHTTQARTGRTVDRSPRLIDLDVRSSVDPASALVNPPTGAKGFYDSPHRPTDGGLRDPRRRVSCAHERRPSAPPPESSVTGSPAQRTALQDLQRSFRLAWVARIARDGPAALSEESSLLPDVLQLAHCGWDPWCGRRAQRYSATCATRSGLRNGLDRLAIQRSSIATITWRATR